MKHLLASALLGLGVLAWLPVKAEDIDLYRQDTGSISAPDVLFFIDNSANWNASIGTTSKRELEHQALTTFFSNPDIVGTMNVGIMLFSKGNSPKGGKIIESVKPLTESYRQHLLSRIEEGLPKTNNAPLALSLEEARRYYGGIAPRSGTQDGSTGEDRYDTDAIEGDGSYDSPGNNTGGCGRHYIVFISNGEPDSGENRDAENQLQAIDGILDSDPINLDPSQFESSWADEYSRWLANNQVMHEGIRTAYPSVYTYVIDVFADSETTDDNQQSNGNKKKGQGGGGQNGNRKFESARALNRSIADQGKGRYFTAASAADVNDALVSIADEIQSVNSVFASTALPVSVNVRGTNLNQVYLGVFRPDGDDTTRWQGNLKLFELALDDATDELFLADRHGNRAQSAVTGFIAPGSESHWSHSSSFWAFSPSGTPPSESDLPDAEVVEKGGVHQRLRDAESNGTIVGQRSVYTCAGGCTQGGLLSDNLFAPSNAAITQADLGAADVEDRADIINWVLGLDNHEDEDGDGQRTDARSSIHGDVLHSRPALINYNRDGTDNDIVAIYGANDGQIRAVQGGFGDQRGSELWSFIPPEFFPRLKALRDNDVRGKSYFADGNVVPYIVDSNQDGDLADAGDKAFVYVVMRRGGNFIYALDISNPDAPRFLWSISDQTAGFAELGETWGAPVVGRIEAHDSPVAVIPGGYDPGADDPESNDSRSMGRSIYVVDAVTGALIWQASGNLDPSGPGASLLVPGMTHSMPADATAIDRDQNGFLDRIYQPDTGGQLWRFDIANPDPSQWEASRLASVGDDQEFLYAPDVVAGGDSAGAFDAILIGAGDREDPFDTSVTNRYYMIKDRAVTESRTGYATVTLADLHDATPADLQNGVASAQTALDASSGWYLTLSNPGEKVVSTATTINGVVFFNTTQPPPADALTCSVSLGIARLYSVSYKDATAVADQRAPAGLDVQDRHVEAPGGGFPPSPVPVVVQIDGREHLAVISGTNVLTPPTVNLNVRQRVYYYESGIR
ncbi:MAG: PilC/PilY family type IV pilus protein [Salinisphaeraceae bacterium]